MFVVMLLLLCCCSAACCAAAALHDAVQPSALLTQSDWNHWKTDNVPVLYDWLAHRNLEWPSSSARWGPILKVRPPQRHLQVC